MAQQDSSSATTYSPQQVAAAFVNQYYQTLRNSPEHVYLFYTDSSTLGREDSNGNMTSVTTMDGINAQIMSTDYTGYVIELQNVDSQASFMGGVLIFVTGSFMTPDAVKKKFTQSFFLAPQGNGSYFVLNDMFRFVSVMPLTAAKENESLQRLTLPAESASPNETAVANESSAASLPVNHVVKSPSANGVALVKNDTGVAQSAPTPAPAVKVATTAAVVEKATPTPALSVRAASTSSPAAKAASTSSSAAKAASTSSPAAKAATTSSPAEAAAASSPAEEAAAASSPVEEAAPTSSAEKAAPTSSPAEKAAPAPPKDVTQRTYASIVKKIKESTLPAPVPTVKSKPSPRPKAAQNAEKPLASDPKSAPAVNTPPTSDKNIPKSKQSDEPGYSIYVKSLPRNATVQMLAQEFRKFGAIKPGGIQVRNRQDGFYFGFVEFESEHSMQEALKAHTVYFGSWESYVEEKRTTTRVVNGVVTRGDDNGSRFQSGRGGYQGENFKGYGSNGNYYRDNGYRNDSARGQGPRGNGYYQEKNGHHQNGNGYYQNGHSQKNANQQRRPSQNTNGTANGPAKQTPAAA